VAVKRHEFILLLLLLLLFFFFLLFALQGRAICPHALSRLCGPRFL
jgi:hypothetical protein